LALRLKKARSFVIAGDSLLRDALLRENPA
jgi:hypothetical protein